MFYKPRYVSYVLTHIGNNSRRDLETEEQLELASVRMEEKVVLFRGSFAATTI
jgi:hypothetical protein